MGVHQSIPDPPDPDAHADLLGELARERGDRRLAGFDLAAGKLPLQRQRLVGATLRDQHLRIPGDQAGDDERALARLGHVTSSV